MKVFLRLHPVGRGARVHDDGAGVVTGRDFRQAGIKQKSADVIDDVGSEFESLFRNGRFPGVDADENVM